MVLKNVVVAALKGRPWLYRHEHDGANPGRIVELDPSGRIFGYNGEQEAHWVVDDGALWFINVHGRRSVRFDVSYRSLGKLVIEGSFVEPGFGGLQVRLDEGQGVERISGIEATHFASSKAVPFKGIWVPYPSSGYGEESIDGGGYFAPEFGLYQLEDVYIASRFGALIKENRLVRETAFQHPFYLCHRLTEDKRGNYLYQKVDSTTRVDEALYACGGMYSNYYHWLMFLMTKIRPEFGGANKTVVISEPTTEFQHSGIEAMARAYGLRPVYLRDNAAISVGSLAFPYQLGTTGVDPHPCVTSTFSILKEQLLDTSISCGERIYISRSDTKERKLQNEALVEATLEAKGFSIVSLTGKTLQEQISIFHNASIVVGPHGAGLTNVGFCQPRASVLEIQNPAHINWCMKRIATISELAYGHVMGRAVRQGENEFALDAAKLSSALEELGL